jgi:hypothetical protein
MGVLAMSVAPPEGGRNRIMIYGPKRDGTYIVEFKTADGEALAISVPAGETRVLKYFQGDPHAPSATRRRGDRIAALTHLHLLHLLTTADWSSRTWICCASRLVHGRHGGRRTMGGNE